MPDKFLTENPIPKINKPERFWTALDVASMLNIKPSTVYQWVSLGAIPYYRLGRTIRFKREDLEVWVENFRKEKKGIENKKPLISGPIRRGSGSIEAIVKRSIAEVKGSRYIPSLEKPGKVKGLGKEGEHGTVS